MDGRNYKDRRQEFDGHTMRWHVLGKLLDVAQTFHDEVVAEKEKLLSSARAWTCFNGHCAEGQKGQRKMVSFVLYMFQMRVLQPCLISSLLWNADGASRELVSSPNLGSPIRPCKNERMRVRYSVMQHVQSSVM